METVRIYRLDQLSPKLSARLQEAQMEAARVWMFCRDLHRQARQQHHGWPTRDDLQKATKGQFALHSQTVQMICHAFLAAIETTRQVRPQNPRMRYPYHDKRYYPLLWPAQAVSIERGRVVLPMGRGRASFVLHVDVPTNAGACKIVWNDGYELHVSFPAVPAEQAPGGCRGTVDLGQIHLGAVTTNTGAALVVSGRGIRSLKRKTGRHHQQRMAQWEYGKDISYLMHKCTQARITSFTGTERGTSSQCPACGHHHKPRGREWICRNPACGFRGHRDIVGSVNMHPLAFGTTITFPQQITYRRAGPTRVQRRNAEPPGGAVASTS